MKELQLIERRTESPFVRWIRRYSALDDGQYTTYADGSLDLVAIKDGNVTRFMISGPATKAHVVTYQGGTEVVVVRLNPNVYLSPRPARLLLDVDFYLPQAGRQSFWLDGVAWHCPTFDNADRFADQLIRQRVLQEDRLISEVSAGKTPDVSVRTVQREFRKIIGLTPHYLQRISQAEQAEKLLAQGMSISDVIHDTGFGDQAYMTHALKYFIGRTPGQVSRDPDGWR